MVVFFLVVTFKVAIDVGCYHGRTTPRGAAPYNIICLGPIVVAVLVAIMGDAVCPSRCAELHELHPTYSLMPVEQIQSSVWTN